MFPWYEPRLKIIGFLNQQLCQKQWISALIAAIILKENMKINTYKDVLVQKDNLTMVTVADVARLDAKMADNGSRTFLGPQPLVQAEKKNN